MAVEIDDVSIEDELRAQVSAVAASGRATVIHQTTINAATEAMLATLSDGKIGSNCNAAKTTGPRKKPNRDVSILMLMSHQGRNCHD